MDWLRLAKAVGWASASFGLIAGSIGLIALLNALFGIVGVMVLIGVSGFLAVVALVYEQMDGR